MSIKEECMYCYDVGEDGDFFYCNTFDDHVCEICVREYYMDCDHCGDTTHNDHGRFIDRDMNVFYCDVCADDYEHDESPAECVECGKVHAGEECKVKERAFPMTIENLNQEGLKHLSEGMDILYEKRNNKEYLEFIKGIMELMKMFEDDNKFHSVLVVLRDETIEMWRDEINKKK